MSLSLPIEGNVKIQPTYQLQGELNLVLPNNDMMSLIRDMYLQFDKVKGLVHSTPL